jgi:hypothetical protein
VRVRARRLRDGGGVGEEDRIEPRATIVVEEQVRRWENGWAGSCSNQPGLPAQTWLRTKRSRLVLTRTV